MGIIVGTDGTGQSMAAVQWAAREARRRDTELRIVYAFDWLDDTGDECVEMARTLAEAVTAAACDLAVTTVPGLAVTTDTPVGHAVPRLLEAARDAELLVVGNRGRAGLAELTLGSVGRRLAVHAPCPVVVVRGRENPDGPVIAGVAAGSGPVLGSAFEAASRRGGGLIALRSFPRRHPEPARLDDDVAPWRSRYPEVPVETVATPGPAATALVNGSHNAQLVVVGSFGSVGSRLLHHSDCPVMIIRP
jgi:nucleotide-binding universal stress UspA family protein